MLCIHTDRKPQVTRKEAYKNDLVHISHDRRRGGYAGGNILDDFKSIRRLAMGFEIVDEM
jgi:hypothetical protein